MATVALFSENVRVFPAKTRDPKLERVKTKAAQRRIQINGGERYEVTAILQTDECAASGRWSGSRAKHEHFRGPRRGHGSGTRHACAGHRFPGYNVWLLHRWKRRGAWFSPDMERLFRNLQRAWGGHGSGTGYVCFQPESRRHHYRILHRRNGRYARLPAEFLRQLHYL